jgi:hypothetical protein
MRRREFIAGLGAAALPLGAQAQLGERVRRIGALMPYNENDLVADYVRKFYLPAFIQGLSELGWNTGRNMRIDYRWAAGADNQDVYRRAASYVDRILRGTNPSDLPVLLPIKFEMSVNLKTAKSLGLSVPESILQRADEVIE